MTDADLVAAYRAGDEAAFDQLLQRHRGMTRKVAGRYFAVGWTYDDLVLEAEVGVWEAACSWEGGRVSFGVWAYFIAQRKIITLVKTSTREKTRPLRAHVDLTSLASFVDVGTVGGVVEGPLDFVLRREGLQEIQERFVCLTGLELTVTLGRMAGESYQEIAERVGVTRKQIDNALQRARKKLTSNHPGLVAIGP